MCDYGYPFGRHATEPTGMIKMVMRVDDKTDGLARNGLRDRFDQGVHATVNQRRLVQDHVVLHLNGNGMM